ncbi:MAG: hypothetical protein L0177_03960 [Chloroflexi bacterium]|nr:hypothetical protein [Chloroflexota bacterium]
MENLADDIQRNDGGSVNALAQKISDGHAWTKHQGEFPSIKTSDDFAKHVGDVMNNPDEHKPLSNSRHAYWKAGTIVITNPKDPDEGTCFIPPRGKKYYDALV